MSSKVPQPFDPAMLGDQERVLLQYLADARAEVARLENDLTTARERVKSAQEALGRFYGGDAAARPVEPIIEVWLTGVSGNILQESSGFDGTDIRQTIDRMYIRGQGFGNRAKLITKAKDALKIADYLEQKAYELRHAGEPTRKTRNDFNSITRSVAMIRDEVRRALGG